MKKVYFLLLVFLCQYVSSNAQGTDSTVFLSIPDPSVLVSIQHNPDSSYTPVFNDGGINSMLSSYTFKVFEPAYPGSRFAYMHDVYKVVASSTGFASALGADYPSVFPHYEIIPPMIPNGYTPNDWPDSTGLWYVYTWYLDFIHARDAWDIPNGGNHGDSSIVIGVTDTYFDTTNPDFAGKIARVGPDICSPYDSGEIYHGTQVAGRIACATDNRIGYPAIGFNCRLDLSTDESDAGMLTLSGTYNRRILNASWGFPGDSTLDITGLLTEQMVYDEIYENGTIACFGAGNGYGTGAAPPYYFYPAALDHNISVTNVNGEGGAGAINYDTHDKTLGDTVDDFQHNPRVDICAPAIRVGGLNFDPDSTNWARYYCHDCGWGTSYASPLVAGTLGLMLSAKPCLSPYQLEYELKINANDSMYLNPYNAYLVSPPRMGAGRLDAGKAVNDPIRHTGAANLDCNDPATQTFYIEGVGLNTICAPGFSMDSMKPKLSPILHNGTGPYTYNWLPLPGNNTTLNNFGSANPTIIASTGDRLAYYDLRVYDNSTIQKVASIIVRISLRSDSSYDLAMRDSYTDMLSEPDSSGWVDSRDWNIWLSPDIWNRQLNDGNRNAEDVQYFSGGDPNYMYVRVRNVGCADYPIADSARLRVYWTLSSTGEHWLSSWTSAEVADTGTGFLPAGLEITSGAPVSIPLMHPGDTFVTAIPWYPVNPRRYAGAPSVMDVCGLARIEEPLKPRLGMAFTELPYISPNIRNNNNIVSRNMEEVNLGHRGTNTVTHRVYVSNAGTVPGTFSIQMLTDKDIQKHFAGNLSEYMTVSLQMQSGLFSAWAAGGYQGNYATKDANSNTVTYDPATPLKLDNIVLDTGMGYYIDVSFALNSTPVNVPASQMVHFRQLTQDSTVYGNVSYSVNIAIDSPAEGGRRSNSILQTPVIKQISSYSVFPNPTANVVHIAYNGAKETVTDITLSDVSGRSLTRQQGISMQQGTTKDIDVSHIDPGMYFLQIRDASGIKEVHKITVLK